MPFDATYHDDAPTREAIDQTSGKLLLEFGASWCGHCQAVSATVETLLRTAPDVRHQRIADGPGRRLGRSFRVKLWPTFVILQDGKVLAQLVRPSHEELQEAWQNWFKGTAQERTF